MEELTKALAVWVPLLISIVGASVSIGVLVRQVKRDKADIAERYENMAGRQLVRIEALESEVTELKQLIQEWEEGIKTLLCQFKELNIEPEWVPKPRKTGGHQPDRAQ